MSRTNKRNLTVIGKKGLKNPLENSDIITTPYEKVLSILLNIKQYISNLSKGKSNLIKDIEWCIKIITSHSLYSYELKDKETINELSKENNEFKELVDFVSEYNEKIIKMNRQYNSILTDKLLQKSSIKLHRRKIDRKNTFGENYSNLLKEMNENINKDDRKKSEDDICNNKSVKSKVNKVHLSMKENYINENNDSLQGENIIKEKHIKFNEEKNINFNKDKIIKSYNSKEIKDAQINQKKSILKHKKKFFDNENELNGNIIFDDLSFSHSSFEKEKEIPEKKDNNNIFQSNLYPAKSTKNKNKSSKNTSSDKIINYSFIKIQNTLNSENYDISKSITSKNFDIFQFETLIGYNNVLPLVGRTILENLGLLDENILKQDKLESFLYSVSNQYKHETLYHNSMHGADVTHSSYIFITHSNAEKLAKTNVIDILSIIIAALGHDLGHPGLTNMFHMNDSTDIAITYNDISILENYHASLLFRTLRKSENNIFEKLSNIDYKIIRKRMISEILSTDMANHGKVVSVIKSKIVLNENNEFRLNLLSGNEQTKNEEQQSLLDFILHLADLAHNTKLFDVSLKWVALLSEEFWRQGDLEKKKNLPVSFLCDREKYNIPQSQKGFITGFIVPTFEIMVTVFPSLKFTLENANNNLKEWQKLIDEGRLTGWTPKKKNNKEKFRKKGRLDDQLGFSQKFVIKEFPVYNFNKNGNNNIKNKVEFETISEMNNSSKVISNLSIYKNGSKDKKNKTIRIRSNKVNKNVNTSFYNINKIPNRNANGKIPCSSKEIKRVRKAFDNSKNRLKISILDDNPPSKNNSNNAITEVNMNIFKKNRKNINKIGNKK